MTELKLEDVLNARPMGIVCGRINVGKTYEAARAFNTWRWLVTNRTALGPYGDRLQKAHALGKWQDYKWPEAKFVLEGDLKDKGGAAKWYKKWVTNWCAGANANKHSYPGLVIDEFTTLCEWILTSISPGQGLRFEEINEIKEIMRWTVEQFSRTERGLIIVGHSRREKRYGENETEKNHPQYGEIKYDGAINLPIGTLPDLLIRELDFTWELVAQDDPDAPEDGIEERFFLTQPGTQVLRKSRRFGIPPKIEVTKKTGLREALLKYNFNIT